MKCEISYKKLRNMHAPRYASYIKAPYGIKIFVEDQYIDGFLVRIGNNKSTFQWAKEDWYEDFIIPDELFRDKTNKINWKSCPYFDDKRDLHERNREYETELFEIIYDHILTHYLEINK